MVARGAGRLRCRPLARLERLLARYDRALVQRLLPQFQPDMLVLADRGSFSDKLWKQAAATGPGPALAGQCERAPAGAEPRHRRLPRSVSESYPCRT